MLLILYFSADNLAKAFYAWIQVRNMSAVAKGDGDRARIHYQKVLMRKAFRAWQYCQVTTWSGKGVELTSTTLPP